MNKFCITKEQIENSPIRTIGIVGYPGMEVIDIVGPMEVFMYSNLALQRENLTTNPVYKVKLLGRDDKAITTLSGLEVGPMNSYKKVQESLDTLIIPGGMDPREVSKEMDLIDWIRDHSKDIRRIASVCSGASVLAEAGLVTGRRTIPDRVYSSEFKDRYPAIEMEPDRIFFQDGPAWSSGGITSGIDLALAMLEEDWGHKLALYIARYLVVFLKRQGGQSRYSDYLKTEIGSRRGIRELQAWIMENPHENLRVEVLAERMAMSSRNFSRVFLAETGVTPAKYVEMVRTALAQHYLESTRLHVSVVAQKVGFKDTETMRKTFIRRIGVNPVDYRTRFGSTRLNNLKTRFDVAALGVQSKNCSTSII